MLLVMPSFMPKNLEISLQACFYCPVHHTLPGDTAVRNGGLKRFSPRWKVCYSACNASPEALFLFSNHTPSLPFCSEKGKIKTKLYAGKSFSTPHPLVLPPIFHPSPCVFFHSFPFFFMQHPQNSFPPTVHFLSARKKAVHDKWPFLPVFSCILARFYACSNPFFHVFVRSGTHILH